MVIIGFKLKEEYKYNCMCISLYSFFVSVCVYVVGGVCYCVRVCLSVCVCVSVSPYNYRWFEGMIDRYMSRLIDRYILRYTVNRMKEI